MGAILPLGGPSRTTERAGEDRFVLPSRGHSKGVRGYGEEVAVQVLIWFLVYLLLIVALTVWRDHHDAARRTKRRRAGGAPVAPAPGRRRSA